MTIMSMPGCRKSQGNMNAELAAFWGGVGMSISEQSKEKLREKIRSALVNVPGLPIMSCDKLKELVDALVKALVGS